MSEDTNIVPFPGAGEDHEGATASAAPPDATDPLLAMVARIEDLELSQRPAAFERVNASLVAELHALEEV